MPPQAAAGGHPEHLGKEPALAVGSHARREHQAAELGGLDIGLQAGKDPGQHLPAGGHGQDGDPGQLRPGGPGEIQEAVPA